MSWWWRWVGFGFLVPSRPELLLLLQLWLWLRLWLCTRGVDLVGVMCWQGPLCTLCTHDHASTGANTCSECWPQWANMVATLVAVVFVVGIVCTMVARSMKPRSRTAAIFRVLINWLQLNATLGDFHLHGPSLMSSWFGFSDVRAWALYSEGRARCTVVSVDTCMYARARARRARVCVCVCVCVFVCACITPGV